MEEFISIQEMMEAYGISRSTAFKWIREGEITTFNFVGDRKTYVRHQDIEKLRSEPVTFTDRRIVVHSVVAYDLISGEEIDIDDPGFHSPRQAIRTAESKAEEWFGGDDVTWYRRDGLSGYLVGRIDEDGNRQPPSVRIEVVEVELDNYGLPKKAAA